MNARTWLLAGLVLLTQCIATFGAADALHEAALDGDNATLNAMLDAGADVNLHGENYETPLHRAVYGGPVSTVRILLARGANVNALAGSGWAPLHIVAGPTELYESTSRYARERPTDCEIAELLIAAGGDVNAGVDETPTPLHLAAAAGRIQMALCLIANGAKLNGTDGVGGTPLHHAAANGHTPTAQMLAERGADVRRRDRTGQTPLMAATWNGHPETAQMLLEHGAELTVHVAAGLGDMPQLSVLLAAAATADETDTQNRTPLEWAATCGHADAVALLLQAGAKLDGNPSSPDSPLYGAATRGHAEIVQQLIDGGASVNGQTGTEQPPLHGACRGNSSECAAILLAAGAAVDTHDGWGRSTALHIAVAMSSATLVGMLLENGADSNAKDDRGWTPLHRLASRELAGEADVIGRILIAEGADLAARTPLDDTALHLAAMYGNMELAALLIEHGADVNARDEHACTPIYWAVAGNDVTMTGLLLRHGADTDHIQDAGMSALEVASQYMRDAVAELVRAHRLVSAGVPGVRLPVTVWLNGARVPLRPSAFAVDGQTYVPVRAMAQALGVECSWDANSKSVRLHGDTPATEVTLTEATFVSGSLFVPLRAMCRAVGCQAEWDSRLGLVRMVQ